MKKTSTIKSTINGKAYEYACVLALNELVSPVRNIEITENSSLSLAKQRYTEDISEQERKEMLSSAKSGMQVIIDLEPKIIEDGKDKLTITLQADNVAKAGDVRDLLIIRRSIKWEIGISVKHNHAALSHFRLSQTNDFGKKLFGYTCSKKYFEEIKPVFNSLLDLQRNGVEWKDLSNKEESVYVPILKAFSSEANYQYKLHSKNVTEGIVKLLLGSNGNDYYKLIHSNNRTTRVMPFNFQKTLSQGSNKPLPKIKLPTRIIEISFKPKSRTTIIMILDNGWAISFRIHNASTIVEPSLKFDVQLAGQPTDLFYIDAKW